MDGINGNSLWSPPLRGVEQQANLREIPKGTPDALQKLERQLEMKSRWERVAGTDKPTAAKGDDLPPLNRMTDRERSDFENKYASELTEAQWTKLFGSDGPKMKELAEKKGNLRVGDLTQLRGDNEGLEAVRSILMERPDLEMSDIVKKKRDGTVAIDPSLFQPDARKLLTNRQDIKPLELTTMGANFNSWLRNPANAKEAFTSAIDLLSSRGGIRPKELEGMMGQMVQSVGGAGMASSPKGGASVVDMFKNGVELLKKRGDITPDQVGKMARETGKLAGKEAGDEGPPLVAQAFRSATNALGKQPALQVDDVIATSQVMRKHFKGEDGKATEDRVRGFEMSMDMMAENPNLKAGHIDAMLTNAKQQQPGLGGPKLLNAFDGMGKGVANGTLNLATLTDPRADKGKAGGVKIDKFGQTQAVDQLAGQAAPPPTRRGGTPRPVEGRPQREGQRPEGPRPEAPRRRENP